MAFYLFKKRVKMIKFLQKEDVYNSPLLLNEWKKKNRIQIFRDINLLIVHFRFIKFGEIKKMQLCSLNAQRKRIFFSFLSAFWCRL